MRTSLLVTTPPAAEPVSLAEAKQHCRIDSSDDDRLLAGYLTAARIKAEGYQSRALLTQKLLWTVRPTEQLHPERSRMPRALYLPRAPIQSIESVVVTDVLGNATTILPATLPVPPNTPIFGYIADLALTPARLVFGRDTPLVDGTLLHWARLGDIQIAFTAGYGAAEAVPRSTVQAILMMTAFLYEHRGDAGGEMPTTADWLLDNERLQFLG